MAGGAFNPELITDPRLNQKAAPALPVMPEPVQPVQAAPVPAPTTPPAPQQVFVPVPIMVPKKEKRTIKVSADVARKAQGIYPAEQQAKQNMMTNAQAATPTPTGAWGGAQ